MANTVVPSYVMNIVSKGIKFTAFPQSTPVIFTRRAIIVTFLFLYRATKRQNELGLHILKLVSNQKIDSCYFFIRLFHWFVSCKVALWQSSLFVRLSAHFFFFVCVFFVCV